MNIQWYPGHMTKTRRMIAEQIKHVDAVCEIVDARIPVSSRNPDVDELTAEGLQTGDIYSVSLYNYSYMGGVHPNETYFSRTFDLSRGAYIDPLEVADDPELFRATVTDLLLDHIQHLDPEILTGVLQGV